MSLFRRFENRDRDRNIDINKDKDKVQKSSKVQKSNKVQKGNNVNKNKKVQKNNIEDFMKNEEVRKMKESLKGKTNDEMFDEAQKIGKQMRNQLGEKEFQKQMNELKKFEIFLNNEQRNKLQDILKKVLED